MYPVLSISQRNDNFSVGHVSQIGHNVIFFVAGARVAAGYSVDRAVADGTTEGAPEGNAEEEIHGQQDRDDLAESVISAGTTLSRASAKSAVRGP